ncbi:MAG: 3-dehydroquinate synthase [Chloroflexota bacterium]|nr:3-dehydroquinate synthase [Chloroflexota bacterium]
MNTVVVTGFMGTGKTTVGREVARRLVRPFVDMDAEIEARAGKSIPRIFAEDGEAAFRRMETALCQELSTQQGSVIATGGGTPVDPLNRDLMMRSGVVICLTCDVDEILRRLRGGDGPNRPLLDVADPRAEIERLLKTRREAYRAIPWQVDTTGLAVEEVAARVLEFSGVITLRVRYPGGEYPIHIGDGLLAHVGGALLAAGVPAGGRIAIVSDQVVAPLYAQQVEAALRAAWFRPFTCAIPAGEQHKRLATVTGLYDQFLAGGLDRGGTVLSLGGGVTGDVAGFAAATFMRGVRFAQAPTTLLAMVDASVGGKTGVDLPQGKNLAGAFKQPALVIVDPAVLATLPAEETRSGLTEVIKHGIIGDPDLFAELEAGDGALSSWWAQDGAERIARALRVKIAIVEEDPFEQGTRAVLNLGHTVGHALETLSGFTLRHGAAVSVGMVAAAGIASKRGLCDPSLLERIETVLLAHELPVRCPHFAADAIWKAMAHDKKRRGRSLRWVLPRVIGDVEIIEDVPPHIVKSILHNLGARSEQ